MHVPKNSKAVTNAILAAAICTALLTLLAPMRSEASMPLQSELQVPQVPENKNFIFSSQGGRQYCGLDQSPISLILPIGFTTEGGAEVRCDANPRPEFKDIQDLNQRLFKDAWLNRGYLVGFYPTVKLEKPILLIIEVDAARLNKICRTCASINYYNPSNQKWVTLPTTIDRSRSRVSSEWNKPLQRSEYPGFPDRMLFALFIKP